MIMIERQYTRLFNFEQNKNWFENMINIHYTKLDQSPSDTWTAIVHQSATGRLELHC